MSLFTCVCACESAYSTSYSGSEASTDISMSSLENLSTSARQEPQGEETADLTPGLLDAGGGDVSLSSSLSSVCGDDADAKSSPWQSGAVAATTTNDWVATTSGSQNQQQPAQLSTALNQSSSIANYRPVVSAGAANSLIRQLLQTSPQYSHLLSDLEPMCGGGSGSPGAMEGKSAGSPKSAMRSGGRMDGRSLPETPSTSSSTSSPRSGPSAYCGSQTTAVNRRLVNRYVNVDEDSGKSLPQQRAYRDRVRPSTAPSEHPPAPAAASLSVTRVKTVADPVERHRSFEVIDRVTGATLPRPSTADPQRKPSTAKRSSPPQIQHQSRDSQPQRTSPQHLKRSSPPQQQQQQQQQPEQKVNGSTQSQQDQQTLSTTSSSSSLCVEQQCSVAENQRSSPPTVW